MKKMILAAALVISCGNTIQKEPSINQHEICGPFPFVGPSSEVTLAFPLHRTVYDSIDTLLEGGPLRAIGGNLRSGDCAACIDQFPYGTILREIVTNKRLIVVDCGEAIGWGRIDEFIPGSAMNKRAWRSDTIWIIVDRWGMPLGEVASLN